MLNLASDLRSRVEAALEHRIPGALTPPQRSAPELMPIGIDSVDALTGGIPLGCLTEICGGTSSGRTSVLMAVIAAFMRRDEICALVDASDAFDPQSAVNAGVDLGKLLWVRGGRSGDRGTTVRAERERCNRAISRAASVPSAVVAGSRRSQLPHPSSPHNPITCSADIESALKSADLLLQAGGFGLVVLDLADIPISEARRIPLTTWFRFRRAVEHTNTALIVVEQQPHAKSCASLVMEFSALQSTWSEAADQSETIVGRHHGAALDGAAFRVTSQGVAIPFGHPVSSFEAPQRWNTPRLLNTVHVHLQVTRSRGLREVRKLPAASESVISKVHYMTQ